MRTMGSEGRMDQSGAAAAAAAAMADTIEIVSETVAAQVSV